MPAFVFFFKLLYPFQLSNLPSNRYVAAAAGGCILVETRVLEAIGGFAAIKAELIDDCALAKAVKAKGLNLARLNALRVESAGVYELSEHLEDGCQDGLYPTALYTHSISAMHWDDAVSVLRARGRSSGRQRMG